MREVIPLQKSDAIADRRTTLDIKVVPARPDSQYVAILHVWSDGLGNVTSDSLLFVQLFWLPQYSVELYDGVEVHIWIYTICTAVLLEVSLRVHGSMWMRRLWTLQGFIFVLTYGMHF